MRGRLQGETAIVSHSHKFRPADTTVRQTQPRHDVFVQTENPNCSLVSLDIVHDRARYSTSNAFAARRE